MKIQYAIFILVMGALGLLVFRQSIGSVLVFFPEVGASARWLASLVLLFLFLLGLSGRLPIWPSAARPVLAWLGYGLMGFFILLFSYSLAADLLTLVLRQSAHLPGVAGGWLGSITRIIAYTPAPFAIISFFAGLVIALRGPQLTHVAVVAPRLHGLKIAVLSDLHIGNTIGADYVRRVVAITNAAAPDIIAMVGDFSDGTPTELAETARLLAELRAPLGRFYVTGNHEYYTDAAAWQKFFSDIGVTVLSNSAAELLYNGQNLLIGGIPDPVAGRYGLGAAPNPARALDGRRADYKILLSHQPRMAQAGLDAGWDLVLCGHTHNGQFFPGTLFVGMVQPFVAGLYPGEKGTVYTSRGTGYWGPPLRLGARAEIGLLTLSPKTD